ncbi:isocitrate dehydrogenase [NAD] subunit beta, mitochondrial-like, partial [Paramuricea clavata]
MATCSGRKILQSSLDGRIFHFLKNNFSHQAALKNHGRIISSHTIKRNFSSEEEAGKPSNRIGGKHTLTMIPGDGVGPELCESVKMVFAAAGVPVEWNEIAVSDIGSYGSKHSLLDVADSLKKTGVAIKGALTTPTSINSQDILSLNQKMKIDLDLFANVVQCKSFAGFKT